MKKPQSLKLEILDHISDPGHRTRRADDALCFNDHMAAVLDGATGLGDQPIFDEAESDAAWLSRFAAPMLADARRPDLPEIVRAVNLAACREVAKRVDISKLPAFMADMRLRDGAPLRRPAGSRRSG
ncbi:MAG: hypothetical protein R3D29_04810 [Nitratireductor sp.]